MKTIAQLKSLLQHEQEEVATNNHTKKTFKKIIYFSTILRLLEIGLSEKLLTKEK